MSKKFNVAVVGLRFGASFVPHFKAHPSVDKVYLCDLNKEQLEKVASQYELPKIGSFDEILLRDDIQAVAIFTPRHTHAPLTISALNAKKHVYSAVPMGISVEECEEIIKAVEKNHRVYMTGETCIYYPSSIFCKREHKKGTFGKFVYGEAQYIHDLSHFPKTFIDDRPHSAIPPFYYACHSTGMMLNACGGHVTRVTAFGYKDEEENTPFVVGENPWDNEFSNEMALMQLSNGGTIRILEGRRMAYRAPSSCVSAFYGTEGTYQFSNAQHLVTNRGWVKKDGKDIYGITVNDVSESINSYKMTEMKGEPDFKQRVGNNEWQWDEPSPIQEEEFSRLPKEYDGLIEGHQCSHKLLIDDFCTAIRDNKMPPCNAWDSARYTIPGIVAHESAVKGGIPLDVPDFGDAPEEI